LVEIREHLVEQLSPAQLAELDPEVLDLDDAEAREHGAGTGGDAGEAAKVRLDVLEQRAGEVHDRLDVLEVAGVDDEALGDEGDHSLGDRRLADPSWRQKRDALGLELLPVVRDQLISTQDMLREQRSARIRRNSGAWERTDSRRHSRHMS